MLPKISLHQYLDSVVQNYNKFKESFPKAFHTAEELNDLFWQLYETDIASQPEILWQQMSHEMMFGCLISWLNSFVNAVSGLDELAQTSARRAIEFVCYINKIRNSDERADLWMRQRKSDDSRKQFIREFSVPRCYFSKEYSHLEKLLLMYDHYSDFGTHANLSMLAMKKKEEGPAFTDIVFDEFRYIPMNVNTKIYLGYLLVESILHSTKEFTRDNETLSRKLEAINSLVRLADAEIISFEVKSGIEPEIINTLLTNPTLLKSKFEKLKQSYSSRDKK